MKNLFLVDGAAGAGKTDMLDYLRTKYGGARGAWVVSKYTTRYHRQEEVKRNLALDLEFVTARRFKALKAAEEFYSYSYSNSEYGFPRARLDAALAKHDDVFVIVRDRATIQQLMTDYPTVRTIPVFVYTDRSEAEKRLRSDGYDLNGIKFRLNRTKLAWSDYLRHFELYNEVIINNSSRNDFHRLIDSLLTKYRPSNEPPDVLTVSNRDRFNLIRPLIGFKPAIHSRLSNYERNVFLMMKFRDANRLVHDFIKSHLEEAGFACVRADDSNWNITQNAYNPLAIAYCCKYGIALFDEAEEGNSYSPNVAYELSMMHTHGKHCLILKNDELPTMPFDLIKDLYKPYKKDLELKGLVRQWVDGITALGVS